MKDTSDYFASEMKRISAKSEDKYNSPDMEYDPNLYKRIVHSNHDYSPNEGETPQTYLIRLKIHQKIRSEISTKTHIETARGRPWHTHVQPNCFMCNDRNFYTVLVSVLEYIQKKYPKLSL